MSPILFGAYLLIYLLTYTMEQSLSWETNWFLASQEIAQILWNSKVLYGIYKYPPPVSILIQLDPVHSFTSHVIKIHFNIILPSMSGSNKLSPSPRPSHQNPVHASPIRATFPVHLIPHYLIHRTILGEEYRSLTLRSLTLYIYGAPILDVSRSHTTTQHSR